MTYSREVGGAFLSSGGKKGLSFSFVGLQLALQASLISHLLFDYHYHYQEILNQDCTPDVCYNNTEAVPLGERVYPQPL